MTGSGIPSGRAVPRVEKSWTLTESPSAMTRARPLSTDSMPSVVIKALTPTTVTRKPLTAPARTADGERHDDGEGHRVAFGGRRHGDAGQGDDRRHGEVELAGDDQQRAGHRHDPGHGDRREDVEEVGPSEERRGEDRERDDLDDQDDDEGGDLRERRDVAARGKPRRACAPDGSATDVSLGRLVQGSPPAAATISSAVIWSPLNSRTIRPRTMTSARSASWTTSSWSLVATSTASPRSVSARIAR